MKPSEILSSPDKWTKGAYARTKTDTIVGVLDEEACKFCLDGALLRCGLDWDIKTSLEQAILELFPTKSEGIISFNDHPDTTYEDVLEVLESCGL